MNLLVVTDLDGSLLDGRDYSFEPARGALEALARRGIPLAACSSKTCAEMRVVLAEMGLGAPFAAENGGGVFFPATEEWRRALESVEDLPASIEERDDLLLLRLGPRYADLLEAMDQLRAQGFPLRGFADMSAQEVAELTGLSVEAARLARQREFDECFVMETATAPGGPTLEQAAQALGYRLTRGTLLHLLGHQEKGRALRLLRAAYERLLGTSLRTIALGDGYNDLPMLLAADTAVLIPPPIGASHSDLARALAAHPHVIAAPHPGPAGWASVLLELLGPA